MRKALDAMDTGHRGWLDLSREDWLDGDDDEDQTPPVSPVVVLTDTNANIRALTVRAAFRLTLVSMLQHLSNRFGSPDDEEDARRDEALASKAGLPDFASKGDNIEAEDDNNDGHTANVDSASGSDSTSAPKVPQKRATEGSTVAKELVQRRRLSRTNT